MKSVQVLKPQLYSFKESLWFLDRGFDDCLHKVTPNSVIKAIRNQNEVVLFELSEDNQHLKINLLNDPKSIGIEDELISFVTEWLDLERDLSPFYKLAEGNNHIQPLTEQYNGLRLIGIPDMFEAFCWCIIGQQINLTFAHRLKTAMVQKYGTYVAHEGVKHYVFPRPEVLAELSIEDLKAIQFSKQKADYVIGLAKIFSENGLDIDALKNLPNSQKMIQELCKIRGVGEWTANYVLMKTLKRMDCITYGDAGLLNGIKAICDLDQKPNRTELDEFFSGFDGWQSYLVFYIWRTLV